MAFKAKNPGTIDSEQREQYDYARRRISEKKNLMRHFIVFLVGAIFIIIINPVLGYGNDFFFDDWYIWAILIWAFIFLVHALNVFLMNSFMGKEWENRQLEKLKLKQAEKIAELQKKVDNELQLPTTPPSTHRNSLNNPLPPDVQ
ncbi:2TM domain-containing protein [Aequorivita sp. H23M31]|uniref:2TM domain-containing protein n=1 Tax=Aequorivita ciconiae TaxID=2494375 RepID=A0A410G6U2_9FLAO|nr:2TM domain-containing protein [Aequorivita sp. H23M31]QAA82993.1 2TM domain-containing protein [Aequorivita sp. H23M31]